MRHKKLLLIILIVLVACFFRFQNLDWDSGYHLHPDERFLTMVGVAMKMPETLSQYLNPAASPMNPANIGFSFFVYGVFPVVFTKLLALLLLADSYNAFTIIGRGVTTVLDTLTVLLVFRSALVLEEEKIIPPPVKYWAAFVYAIFVLPIQYAHFFTSDIFLNFFIFGAFYFALSAYRRERLLTVVLSALFFGLAVASKINAVLAAPLIAYLLLWKPIAKREKMMTANIILICLAVSYTVVRLAAPYYFQSGDPFAPAPSELFVQNLKALRSFEGKDVMYPPALQWINTVPVIFPILNLALFGMGLPLFMMLAIGLVLIVKHSTANIRNRKGWLLAAIFGWTIAVFLYQSVQFVKVMRYFLIFYPFFAIAAGWGAWRVLRLVGHTRKKTVVLIAVMLVWPLVFSSVYFVKNTRVQATEWIYRNIPENSLILSEYWDDPLPIAGGGYANPRAYRGDNVTVFDPDTPQKEEKIAGQLKTADYYIMSSNRGWGTLPAVPERFPFMGRFYNDMFDGKLGYRMIKAFYPVYYPCRIFSFSCPRLLSSWIDESFTVYDHPTVYIFKNTEKK